MLTEQPYRSLLFDQVIMKMKTSWMVVKYYIQLKHLLTILLGTIIEEINSFKSFGHN